MSVRDAVVRYIGANAERFQHLLSEFDVGRSAVNAYLAEMRKVN
jgi:hypothetical protein